MNPAKTRILTINGGSSSIKFALFESGKPLERRLSGMIDRIGLSGTTLTFNEPTRNPQSSISLASSTHKAAASVLLDWLEEQGGFGSVGGVGHRVVHGRNHTQPELVRPELLTELHRISPYAPEHLPGEIELIEAFLQRHPMLLQVPALTRHFTAPCHWSPSCYPSPVVTRLKESSVMVSTGCPIPI